MRPPLSFSILLLGASLTGLSDGFIVNTQSASFSRSLDFSSPQVTSVESLSSDEASTTNGTDAPNTNNNQEEDVLVTERTLYDVLGASPDDSREELKRKYVQLARQTHPDAIVGSRPEDIDLKEAEFREIAAAWRVLANSKERLRYDRSLKAKAFTENVERLAEQGLNNFFRRTNMKKAETDDFTLPTTEEEEEEAEAEAEDNHQANDMGKAVQDFGKRMGRVIDRLALIQKSRDLEQLAIKEAQRVDLINLQLQAVAQKRLQMKLHTPNSKLTSQEALSILDNLKDVDKEALAEKINFIELVKCEQEYYSKLQVKEREARKNSRMIRALHDVIAEEDSAVQYEEEIRRQLEEAQDRVMLAKRNRKRIERAKHQAASQEQEVLKELEQISLTLERRQEKVRAALRRKEEEQQDLPVEHFNLSDIEVLRKEEDRLISESEQMEDRARRLQSRAEKLMLRAQELRREQNYVENGERDFRNTTWKRD